MIAEGTGERLPKRFEKTGATADIGEHKHKIIIFLTVKSIGKIKKTNITNQVRWKETLNKW